MSTTAYPAGTVLRHHNTGDTWTRTETDNAWTFRSGDGRSTFDSSCQDIDIAHSLRQNPDRYALIPVPYPVGTVITGPGGGSWTKDGDGTSKAHWRFRAMQSSAITGSVFSESELREFLDLYDDWSISFPPKPAPAKQDKGKRVRLGDVVRYRGVEYTISNAGFTTDVILVNGLLLDPSEVEFVRRGNAVGKLRYNAED